MTCTACAKTWNRGKPLPVRVFVWNNRIIGVGCSASVAVITVDLAFCVNKRFTIMPGWCSDFWGAV